MKKLCFVFCFFLFLSCNEQIIEHSETIIEKSEYQLSIEDVFQCYTRNNIWRFSRIL